MAARAHLIVVAAFLPSLAARPAWSGTGGADLPWNQPLQVVVDNLTGPTAKTISALAFMLGGAGAGGGAGATGRALSG